jgi:hypothetical protein
MMRLSLFSFSTHTLVFQVVAHKYLYMCVSSVLLVLLLGYILY